MVNVVGAAAQAVTGVVIALTLLSACKLPTKEPQYAVDVFGVASDPSGVPVPAGTYVVVCASHMVDQACDPPTVDVGQWTAALTQHGGAYEVRITAPQPRTAYLTGRVGRSSALGSYEAVGPTAVFREEGVETIDRVRFDLNPVP